MPDNKTSSSNKAIKISNVRSTAARAIAQVVNGEGSFASLIPKAEKKVNPQDLPLLKELCFGTLRWYHQLQAILNRLLEKPLRAKDRDIESLLLLGLYQIREMRTPDHAVIDLTVKAVADLKKDWAKNLVNGVLRRYLRECDSLVDSLSSSPGYLTSHPNWLRKQIEKYWPEHSLDVFTGNNQRPPMTLRVNQQRATRDDFLSTLAKAEIAAKAGDIANSAVILESPMDVAQIPGFLEGIVSVQDEAPQLSAQLLNTQPGDRVLDACCAPGGKTGHILESQPDLSELVAIDLEPERLERVRENLERLAMQATLVAADVADLDNWWDGKSFDRILADVPCSATGVIRRNPDIKVLRKSEDIAKLAALQLSILKALWTILAPGGRLVYATCSILPTENTQVIEAFLAEQADAKHEVIDADWGIAQPFGRQLLPSNQPSGHDGFYYACLQKG